MHVHVYSPDGEAKYWIEPQIELAVSKGLSQKSLGEVEEQIRKKEDEIRASWNRHFRITE